MAKEKCDYCRGTGEVHCECVTGFQTSSENDDCYVCGGTGEQSCSECNGRGWTYQN